MLFFTLVLIFLITLIIHFYNNAQKAYKHWEERGIKYAKPTLILGNLAPSVLKRVSTPEFIKNLYKSHPNESYFGIFQFLTPTLVIRDPELIKQITIKKFDHFIDHKVMLDPELEPLFSKNLFSSRGENWRKLRQTLSPFFTGSKLRLMFSLMEECALRFVSHVKSQGDVVEFELKSAVSKFTNDVIANIAFGVECDTFKSPDNEFYTAGQYLANFSGLKRLIFFIAGTLPKLTKLLKVKMSSEKIDNFFKNVIAETLKIREENQIVRNDLINLLMLARKGKFKLEDDAENYDSYAATHEFQPAKISPDLLLTVEDITAQAMLFFLGGFDTVANIACFACYELAVNPETQAKLRSEIITNSEKLTYENIVKMKYLDMVLSETLRKWPPAVLIDRICTKDLSLQLENNTDLEFKLGDVIWCPVYGIHHDPKYYPNPDHFDPERFSDENKDKIEAGSYLPFGIGPRNCIGSRFALLEIKIFLCHVLLNFEVGTSAKMAVPLKISKDNFLPFPEGGFQLRFKKID